MLASVRDLREAATVLQAGASIVDLKEPNHGPLAPVDPEIWTEVAGTSPTDVQLSAALGEADQATQLASLLPGQFRFAKPGVSGLAAAQHLRVLWSDVAQQLGSLTEIVAVAYADHDSAGCLDPLSILRTAVDQGLKWYLIDTYRKNGASTLDHLTPDQLSGIADFARQNGVQFALAGSLTLTHARSLSELGITPDIFGVRGDLCAGDRRSTIDAARVRLWVETLARLPIALGP